jgi:hypothetical protein
VDTAVDQRLRDPRSSGLRSFRTCRTAALVFLVAYVIVAWAGGHYSRRGEYFPVFNWSLYTRVSPVRSLYELYVIQIGDQKFDRPVLYANLASYFDAKRVRSTNVKKTLQRMAKAAQARNWDELERIRVVLENEYLSGRGLVRYEIHLTTFRPIERWRENRLLRDELVARYTYDRSP